VSGATWLRKEAMERDEFVKALKKLGDPQKNVLVKFLAGETDDAIAQALGRTEATVRKHIQVINRVFRIKNEPGERFSLRQKLM
jgi:DNA-binding NarL/FixJ family response regulator